MFSLVIRESYTKNSTRNRQYSRRERPKEARKISSIVDEEKKSRDDEDTTNTRNNLWCWSCFKKRIVEPKKIHSIFFFRLLYPIDWVSACRSTTIFVDIFEFHFGTDDHTHIPPEKNVKIEWNETWADVRWPTNPIRQPVKTTQSAAKLWASLSCVKTQAASLENQPGEIDVISLPFCTKPSCRHSFLFCLFFFREQSWYLCVDYRKGRTDKSNLRAQREEAKSRSNDVFTACFRAERGSNVTRSISPTYVHIIKAILSYRRTLSSALLTSQIIRDPFLPPCASSFNFFLFHSTGDICMLTISLVLIFERCAKQQVREVVKKEKSCAREPLNWRHVLGAGKL